MRIEMVDKFGPNGAQLARFVEAAHELRYEWVSPVVEETRSQAVRDARTATEGGGFSAARYSAVDSAARNLVRSIRATFPKSASTGERFTINRFTSMVNSAVFAFASRPVVDDETVGLVVDPFTSRLGFEWRSWGVSVTGDLGESRG